MEVRYAPVASSSAQDFGIKDVSDTFENKSQIGTSENAPMLAHDKSALEPHRLAVEKRENGTLPGLDLKQLDSSQVENMSEKLKLGPISFEVQSTSKDGKEMPLKVTCQLNKPDSGCYLFKGPPIYICISTEPFG